MTDASIQPTRSQITVRILFTIGYLIIFQVLTLLVQVVALFHFVFLLITREPIPRLQLFGNRLSTYGYRLLRYITLSEHSKPYPMNDFPREMDPPEETITFD